MKRVIAFFHSICMISSLVRELLSRVHDIVRIKGLLDRPHRIQRDFRVLEVEVVLMFYPDPVTARYRAAEAGCQLRDVPEKLLVLVPPSFAFREEEPARHYPVSADVERILLSPQRPRAGPAEDFVP